MQHKGAIVISINSRILLGKKIKNKKNFQHNSNFVKSLQQVSVENNNLIGSMS